jgi:transcriptional regulator with XRE-family HTH domain
MAFTDDFKARLIEAFQTKAKGGRYTRRDLAKACGVSAPTVSKWLDPKNTLTPVLLKVPLIAKALNVTAGYLIDGDKKGSPDPSKQARAHLLIVEAAKLLADDEQPVKAPKRP